MASDVKSIDEQVRTLVGNINKLQAEIKKYQSGYEAFQGASSSLETASYALSDLAKKQANLVDALAKTAKDLEKVEVGQLVKQNEKILKKLNALEARLDEGVTVKKRRWFK